MKSTSALVNVPVFVLQIASLHVSRGLPGMILAHVGVDIVGVPGQIRAVGALIARWLAALVTHVAHHVLTLAVAVAALRTVVLHPGTVNLALQALPACKTSGCASVWKLLGVEGRRVSRGVLAGRRWLVLDDSGRTVRVCFELPKI